MPANRSEFEAGGAGWRPMMNRMGDLVHPVTGVALPADRKAKEWEGSEGYQGRTKEQAAKRDKVVKEVVERAATAGSTAGSKRQAVQQELKLKSQGVESTSAGNTGSTGRQSAKNVRDYINGRIKSAKAALFGDSENPVEPEVSSNPSEVLGSLNKVYGSLGDYANNIESYANEEIDHHTQRAAREGDLDARNLQLKHVENLKGALQAHLEGLKLSSRTVNRGDGTREKNLFRTRLDFTNHLTEAGAVANAAVKELTNPDAAAYPEVANASIKNTAKAVSKALAGIRTSPLGKLGVLPRGITHQDVVNATASANGLPTAKEPDYTKLPIDVDERTGAKAPAGHVWIGSHESRDPNTARRAVKVHPDTVAKLMQTPRNGRPRTKNDPDVVRVQDAIAEARSMNRGPAAGRYQAGLGLAPAIGVDTPQREQSKPAQPTPGAAAQPGYSARDLEDRPAPLNPAERRVALLVKANQIRYVNGTPQHSMNAPVRDALRIVGEDRIKEIHDAVKAGHI